MAYVKVAWFLFDTFVFMRHVRSTTGSFNLAHVIPLIRAAALVPFLRWLTDNKRPVERLLAAAGLAGYPMQEPDAPIPLLNGCAFICDLGRLEGPDIGCRVVSSSSMQEIATLGRIALSARTPREALTRIGAALPHHCTHEHITLQPDKDVTIVREVLAVPLDAETLHLTQQYVAMLIQTLCEMTRTGRPMFDRVEIIAHPKIGVAHLSEWLGPGVVATEGRALVLRIRNTVMDAPFRAPDHSRTVVRMPAEWRPLRADGSFVASARTVLTCLFADGTPTVDRLAASAGISVRTLQRRLAEEDTTFSAVLDVLRREQALGQLTAQKASIGDIAALVGYAHQTSLTRSVRRWTGTTPRKQR